MSSRPFLSRENIYLFVHDPWPDHYSLHYWISFAFQAQAKIPFPFVGSTTTLKRYSEVRLSSV